MGGSAEPGFDEDEIHIRPVSSLSATEFAVFERLAFCHGRCSDSYLAVEQQRHCYLSRDHRAAVSVIPVGRVLHISGGILAPPELHLPVIRRLEAFARKTRRTIACYSLNDEQREVFEAAGWEVSKLGEDTMLSLQDLTWSGKAFEWVRRQENYCRRSGLTSREVPHRELEGPEWNRIQSALLEVQAEDLRDRIYAQEMSLLLGRLEPENLQRRRLFIAEDSVTGRIQAFVITNPMNGGRGWSMEMYRKRADTPRGTMPFLLKQTIDVFRSENAEEVSLCLIPWKDCHTYRGPRSSLLIRYAMALATRLGGYLYNIKGMTLFKTRFRPRLTNFYVAVTPKTTVLSSLNFLYTVGVFSLSVRNLFRQWLGLSSRTGSESQND